MKTVALKNLSWNMIQHDEQLDMISFCDEKFFVASVSACLNIRI